MFTEPKIVVLVGGGPLTKSEKEFREASHSLVTKLCPSIPKLEMIARGRGTLDQRVHKNTCSYCQQSIGMFRERLGLKPWPERLFRAAQQAVKRLKEIVARELDLDTRSGRTVFAGGQLEQGTRGDFRCADALILRPDLTSLLTKVEVRKLDFVEHRDLWMILRLQESLKELSDDSCLELMVMSDTHAFGPFTLPSPGTGHEEEIMLRLPRPLAESWQAQMKTSFNLPFQFVFSIRDNKRD